MRLAIVPGALALLPQYAGIVDPIAELRRACQAAVHWLVEETPASVTVLGDTRIADALLPEAHQAAGSDVILVVANGSARRGEKAPGHMDSRARPFDAALGAALMSGDTAAIAGLDDGLAAQLLATGIRELKSLRIEGSVDAKTWYADDPFGVQYWVVTWAC